MVTTDAGQVVCKITKRMPPYWEGERASFPMDKALDMQKRGFVEIEKDEPESRQTRMGPRVETK